MAKLKRNNTSNPTGSNQSKKAQEQQDKIRFSRRVLVILLAAVFGIVALLSRAYYLQVLRHDYYRTRSQKNRVKLQVVPPLRGNVFDRTGVALSENILSYNLVINRAKSTKIDELIPKIKAYMRFDENDLSRYEADKKKKLYNQNVIARPDLSEEEMNRFLVDLYQFPGFEVIPAYKRYYPYGDLTAHIVGYINNLSKKDLDKLDSREYSGTTKTGRTGIEKAYENVLHGQAGFRQAEVSRTGKIVRVLEQIDSIPGDDLILSLDLSLQGIIRDELEKEGFDGAGVALDPGSGEVLAMFSNPSFDANLFVNGISHKDYNVLKNSPRKNLFNRALNGNYSPASTIKPMMALAALHHYVVTPDMMIDCLGSYRIPEYKNTRKFYCWKRTGHGDMNTYSSIVQSCDVYYYSVGKALGIQRIHEYLSQFNLGVKTGIDLPNESTGNLPSKAWKQKKYQKSWFIGDTINVSIGQGYMTTTPLQLAYFTAVLGAKGKRFTPHFVTALRNPISGEKQKIQSKLDDVKQDNPHAWTVVHQTLLGVMNGKHGTGRGIKVNLPFKIAGKTGTAQVFSFKNNKRIKKDDLTKALRDNSVFITYAPAENPIIALAVILENAGGGGETAGPIAVKVLERYFTTLAAREQGEDTRPSKSPSSGGQLEQIYKQQSPATQLTPKSSV
ncbi:MAG: penicillin-binding protein 2 [Ostreibacterium sp.]